MLKDLGIKSRVLVLILLPSTVLAVALGIYFTWMQLSEMRHQLDARGQLIAEQLAPLAAPAMAQGYGKRLQRILNQVLDQPDVRAVSILDAERNLQADHYCAAGAAHEYGNQQAAAQGQGGRGAAQGRSPGDSFASARQP